MRCVRPIFLQRTRDPGISHAFDHPLAVSRRRLLSAWLFPSPEPPSQHLQSVTRWVSAGHTIRKETSLYTGRIRERLNMYLAPPLDIQCADEAFQVVNCHGLFAEIPKTFSVSEVSKPRRNELRTGTTPHCIPRSTCPGFRRLDACHKSSLFTGSEIDELPFRLSAKGFLISGRTCSLKYWMQVSPEKRPVGSPGRTPFRSFPYFLISVQLQISGPS